MRIEIDGVKYEFKITISTKGEFDIFEDFGGELVNIVFCGLELTVGYFHDFVEHDSIDGHVIEAAGIAVSLDRFFWRNVFDDVDSAFFHI